MTKLPDIPVEARVAIVDAPPICGVADVDAAPPIYLVAEDAPPTCGVVGVTNTAEMG